MKNGATQSISRENNLSVLPTIASSVSSQWPLIIAALVLLCTGSIDSLITKLMNFQENSPCPGCDQVKFEAPFFQVWAMYVAEALCLIAYYADRAIAKYNGTQQKLEFTASTSFNKPECPVWWWVIPAALDFIATACIQYAYVFSQASTIQMLRSFNVVLTAFLSLVWIRLALRVHQVSGVVIVTCGLALTALVSVLYPETENNHHDAVAWAGLVLVLGGTTISSFQVVFEESLFRKYRMSPLKAVGFMGIFGLIISSVVLIIFELLPFDGLEKTSQTFYMMSHGNYESIIIISSNILSVVLIAAFNASGLIVSKLGSAILRVVIMTARTIFIWIAELIIGWTAYRTLQLGGMVFIIVGVLFYNLNFITKKLICGDTFLRKPLVCCNMLKNPDIVFEDTEADTIHENPVRDVSFHHK